MNIQNNFNKVAKEYDKNRINFIPCFDDYYDNTTKLITSNIESPKRILDLGAGTGLLSSFWFQQFPTSEYVLVDIADEMLNIARKRFSGIENVCYKTLNYVRDLPSGNFDTIISALSIHHLENDDKQNLFNRINKKLPKGGLFVNYDQFCSNSKRLNKWINTYWENQLKNSSLSKHDIELWDERKRLDRECSIDDEIEMLRNSGFSIVECFYKYQKFSVILSIK